MENRKYFLLSTFFIVLVVAGLTIVALRDMIPAIANILMLLVGLFAMASISAFHRIIEISKDRPVVNITFNEQIVSSQLDTAAERVKPESIDAKIIQTYQEPWEVQAEDLLGQDNSLALAKLRIDIEKELRQLANIAGIESSLSRYGLRNLAQELNKREILDRSLLSAIDDILPAVNQAIHGKEVSTDVAASILRLGNKLLNLLRATRAEQRKLNR